MNKSESKYFNTALRMDEALLALLEEKDLEYITVKEICHQAGVNRSTFYLHYETIADLVNETMEMINQRFLSYFPQQEEEVLGNMDSREREELVLVTREYLLPYLCFIRDNKKVYRAAFRNPNSMQAYARYGELKQHILAPILERFEIQCRKHVYNFPFLMGQGVWLDSDKLDWNDEVREVLKHGTLSVGFIGLAECLKALVGVHHGESEKARVLGREIVAHMRARMDAESAGRGLNFSLLATPAEGLSGRFVRIDKEKYGTIPGVTDRDYYTNSFHVPVYFPISAHEKIAIEAPYHALTNAGHITYIEMDGDPCDNLEAFERVIRDMKEHGIGYGSVNHPVDRDPVCGFSGIIGDQCPGCGRTEADGVPFERIRRITGYLVGTLDRFNNAKRAEERDRVKHSV